MEENDRREGSHRERLEEVEPSRWNGLVPEELLLHCFSFLSPKDLARIATVCRQWKRISDSEVLWKHHLLKMFPRLSIRLEDGTSAKALFTKFKKSEVLLTKHRGRFKTWDRVKVTLLGCGESGKATLYKQFMNIFEQNYFTEELNKVYAEILRSNLIHNIKTLIHETTRRFNFPIPPSIEVPSIKCSFVVMISKKDVAEIESSATEWWVQVISPELKQHIKNVWKDSTIQQVYVQRNLFQLCVNCEYLMKHIDRLCDENYVPTIKDILYSRAKTTGIVTHEFQYDQITYVVNNTGGQRSERRKWIHLFDGIDILIFVVALDEYDLVLYEDEITNRMHESLRLWEDICNSKWFSSKYITMTLLFTHSDTFKQKLPTSDLRACFPDFTGPNDYDTALQFIQKKFLDKNKSPKDVQSYVVCTLETEEVKLVLLDIMQHFKLNLFYSLIEDEEDIPQVDAPSSDDVPTSPKKSSLADKFKNLFNKKKN